MIDWSVLPLIWLVLLVATLLRSFTGFGFGLAAVPGLALFFEPTAAVVLVSCLSVALGVQSFSRFYKHIDLRSQWPMFVTAAIGTLLGARLLQELDSKSFMAIIGVLVIVACVSLTQFRPRRRPVKPVLAAGTGLISGVMNGAFVIPGPPIVIYVMSTVSDPKVSRALMMAFFFFSSVIAATTYSLVGWVNSGLLWTALAAYPAVILGDWVGNRLFRHYGGAFYRRVAIVTLFLLGVAILLKALV